MLPGRLFRDYESSSAYLMLVQPLVYGTLKFLRPFDQHRISILFWAFLGSITISMFLWGFSANPPNYTPEHAKLYGFDNTVFQRLFYLVFASSVFLYFVISGFTGKSAYLPPLSSLQRLRKLRVESLIAVTLLVIGVPLAINYLDTLTARRIFPMIFFSILIGCALLRSSESKKGIVTLCLFFMASFAYFYIVPFFTYYSLAEGEWWGIDHHWAGIIGHGLLPSFLTSSTPDFVPEYGLYLNLLIASLFNTDLFSGFGGAIRFLQTTHLLFALLLLGIIVQRTGGKNLAAILLSFLLILLILAPLISGFAPTIKTPNQSPIRYLFIPLTLLAAPLLARSPILLAWAIGASLNITAMFYNLETGLVCMLGTGFALFIRSANLGIFPLLLGGTLYGAIAGLTGYALWTLLTVLLPQFGFAPLQAPLDLPKLMELFAGGYGGKKFFWYLPFFLILGHVFYLFSGWLKSIHTKQPIDSNTFQSIVLTGMIVAVTPYMVNRFLVQNMWIMVLLYLLLILPGLASKETWKKYILLIFVVGVLAPQQLGETRKFAKDIKKRWQTTSDQVCFDGLVASPDFCSFMQNKAAELSDFSQKNKIAWISGTPMSVIRFTGISPSINKIDAFSHARTPTSHADIIQGVRNISPDFLLIDAVNNTNLAGLNPRINQWQNRLVSDLGYSIVRKSDYWIYAKRKAAN